ncbi:condensation domain-containing protein, partial [Xenorhabdus sp. SGI246]|uniref:condensation domain-containing protein n=1 Tax=Xenorhabdus sp. SGI246 TaxID=3158263 RepID=UPI00349FB601
LWFTHEHMEGQQTAYNMLMAFELHAGIRVDLLGRAFNALVCRHEALRTTFATTDDGCTVQRVMEEMVLDIPELPITNPEMELYVNAFANESFDLASGPLLKAVVLKPETGCAVLLINTHHIVSDGWSEGVLTRDLQCLYRAAETGKEANLPVLPVQYTDYACWQRRQDLSDHLDFWKTTLHGYEDGLDLPYDYPRPPTRAWRAGLVRYTYPKTLSQGVARFGHAQGATLFMVLLSGLAVVLQRYTGRDDICIGTTTAGRDAVELENLIGFFINILPLRLDLSGEPTAPELLSRIKDTVLHGFAHHALPFEHLLKELRLQRESSQVPLVPVVVRHQNYRQASLEQIGHGLSVNRTFSVEKITTSEMDFQFFGDGDALEVVIEYAADLFSEETIQRLIQHHQ